ncbi:hypothetical protein FACS1894170_02810 [Planctomycetales bacterium]|nr:hypothetical protein FACS1894170_02810 [Planctomycetales bacterium]
MKAETEKLLAETKERLFVSDEFSAVRKIISWTPPNSGEVEDLDVMLDRIDRFAPGMQEWLDSMEDSFQ